MMELRSNWYRYCHPHPKPRVRPHYRRPLKKRRDHAHRSHPNRKIFTAGVRFQWVDPEYFFGTDGMTRPKRERDELTGHNWIIGEQYETFRKYRGEPPRMNEILIAGEFQRSRLCLAESPMDLRREKGRKSWQRGAAFFV